MGRRRRYREDNSVDIAKAVAALFMLVGLFAFVQPQLFAFLVQVGVVILVVAVLAAGGVFYFKWRRAQRQNYEVPLPTVIDLQTLSRVPRPRSIPTVVTVAPLKTSPRSAAPPPPSPPPRRITQEDLAAIDWFQFEKVIGLLYEARGNRVERRGGANPDGGIDLVLYRNGESEAVQCKHWKVWKVGVRHFREFFGGMKAEGLDRGIFIALSGCTDEAQDFADRNGIKILAAPDIEAMLAHADAQTLVKIQHIAEDPTKHCPKCGAPMVIKVAERGPHAGSRFWGCSTYGRTRCNGKIQID